MAQEVSPAMYYELDGQLSEIKRQLRQPTGYPFDAEELKDALQAIIEGYFNLGKAGAFPVWRTLSIGGVSKDELLKRLGDGFFVSDWAKDIMSKPAFTTLPEPAEIQLVKTKVKNLDFKEEPTTAELFARIKDVGDLCPAEAGPHLRLADEDQPKDTWYWIAMEPITRSDGGPGVFSVRRGADVWRWLYADCARPGSHWDLEVEVVFRSRK